MDASDINLLHTVAVLRALLERVADQAAKLSAIVGRALESSAFSTAASSRRVRLPGLTPRECDVLELLLEGLSSKEIARSLGISRATARCHVQNILTKLGVYSRTQAAALATESSPTKGGRPASGPAGGPMGWPAVEPAVGSVDRLAGGPATVPAVGRLASLTPRETEVLRALAAGMERREIAEHFVVSPHTVRTHVQRVLAKLGVHSVLGAMAVARDAGVTPLPPRPSR
jgi:DNA-binding NarL/FixJ family response regulator